MGGGRLAGEDHMDFRQQPLLTPDTKRPEGADRGSVYLGAPFPTDLVASVVLGYTPLKWELQTCLSLRISN